MQGDPAGRLPDPDGSPEDPDDMVGRLRVQMTVLKRWFKWERWLLEPRSFAPPDDDPHGDDDGFGR